VYLALRGFGAKLRDESDVSPRDLTRIDVCWSVAFALALVDTIRAMYFQQLLMILALRSGERGRVARALSIEVSFLGMGGARTWKRTSRMAEMAMKAAEAVGNTHAVAWVKATTGTAMYLAGRFAEGLALTRESEAIFRNEIFGAAWEIFTVRLFTLQALAHLGRLRELAEEQPATLREATERGDLHAEVNTRVGHANLVWLVAGHPDMARRQCVEAVRQWSAQGFHLEHYYALVALTNVDLYEGHGRAALDRVRAEWPALERSLITRVEFVRLHAWMARARATVAAAAAANKGGSEQRALLHEASRDARRIERCGAPWALPHAALIRAGVTALRGDDAAVRELLQRAVRDFAAGGMALMENVARGALGARMGGDEGRALVATAETWMRDQTVQSPERMSAVFAPGLHAKP
jgi:hypothetical protein